MSYTSKIPQSELGNFAILSDWGNHYTAVKRQFNNQNPLGNIADVKITIKNKIFTSNSKFNFDLECEVEFINCYFKGSILFIDSKYNKRVAFRQCFCDSYIRIEEGVEFSDKFDLIDFTISEQLYVQGGTYKECNWSLINNATLKINEGDFKRLRLGYWGGMELQELTLTVNKVIGNVEIIGDKSRIEKFHLTGTSDDLSISISNAQINKFTIAYFKMSKRLLINNIKPFGNNNKQSIFAIVSSYLNTSEFNSINFNDFNDVHFYDSQFTSCSWDNIQWKSNIWITKSPTVYRTKEEESWGELVNKFDTESINSYYKFRRLRKKHPIRDYYFRKREIFRQLKYSASKQGDSVNEQMFHGLEMKSYNRALPWSIANLSTKLIIKLSRHFSNFGQSFILPILALLIGHLILVCGLIYSGNYEDLKLSFKDANWEGLELATNRFISLINPLRKLDVEFKGYLIFFDLAMRIWSSYMIYNIVRASRRFIK